MIFGPGAPPIAERLKALRTIHSEGVTTIAMIAPVLPGAEGLVDMLKGSVDHLLVDRLNYN